ncbi:DUF4236 domain-containing protein [Streptomyces sp. DB-54]
MGLRINKSFKIAPGVCIWLGTKSSSLSVGGKAVRVTLNSRGRRTTTVHLAPGVSYSTSKGQGRTRVALSCIGASSTTSVSHWCTSSTQSWTGRSSR